MERREKMLKRLSRKENILELINEYGKNPSKEELRVYENKINAVCSNLKYSQSCKDNKIRSLYYAMVIPYLDRIRDCWHPGR